MTSLRLAIGALFLGAALVASWPSAWSDANAQPAPADMASPGFAGATRWLNSRPLSGDDLRGKVVLVEFWTRECINCVHVLPHTRALYDKYAADGLVVIGVHTPEYDEERDTAGVQAAWFAPRHGDHGSVSLGAEVRPLFLARFLSNREQGPARVDLLLDSIHLGMAARLGPRRPGLDLSAGLELPLPRSFQGFFLGLQGLWSLPHAAQIGPHGSEGLALLTLGFRGVVDTHVVDSRDRVYR